MNITLAWDQKGLDVFTGQLPKRLAYATVNAVANTAKRIQLAEFERSRSIFAIRKERFFFGTAARPGGVAARITQFPNAKKGIAYAEIEAGPSDNLVSGTDRRRLLYPEFETGGERKPFTPGAKSLAVPRTGGAARPTTLSPITPSLTFAKMRLQAYRKGKKLTRNRGTRKNVGVGLLGEYGRVALPEDGGGVQWKGRERTWIAFTDKHPLGTVMQRTGKKEAHLVWLFVKPFKLHDRLEFVKTAEKVAAQYFREECERQVEDVLQHDALKALRASL